MTAKTSELSFSVSLIEFRYNCKLHRQMFRRMQQWPISAALLPANRLYTKLSLTRHEPDYIVDSLMNLPTHGAINSTRITTNCTLHVINEVPAENEGRAINLPKLIEIVCSRKLSTQQ